MTNSRERAFLSSSVPLAALAALIAGCSESSPADPIPPPSVQTATVTGFIYIRDEVVETPLAGATVTIRSVSATSAQNGRFEMANVPVGLTSASVTAAGFDPAQQGLSVQAGTNTITMSLLPVNTMYEAGQFLVYVPSGVSTVRGVFFFLIGGNTDSRPFLRDDLTALTGTELSEAQNYRRRMMALARAHGLALIGAPVNSSSPAAILGALVSVSEKGRPELAHAPLMFHGNSGGVCPAYDFTVKHPDRVIGFIIAKAAACLSTDASPARGVPGYFIFGELDTVLPTAGAYMTALFAQHRANGALWALAVERGAGHEHVGDHNLLFNWMGDVITRRLPATITPGAPVQLRPVVSATGWLGDGSSSVIAEFGCYNGDKLSASWLPSEGAARNWQTMVSRGSVNTITPCGL